MPPGPKHMKSKKRGISFRRSGMKHVIIPTQATKIPNISTDNGL
ncbi:hypothetical protein SDC9_126624 [bioreactor metagenome]|uniref:Uncharacterized protein n=1 Tax=bioreactor metagenome TaxID=1076179 RepID=A0A645CRR0_9ZZZZ